MLKIKDQDHAEIYPKTQHNKFLNVRFIGKEATLYQNNNPMNYFLLDEQQVKDLMQVLSLHIERGTLINDY